MSKVRFAGNQDNVSEWSRIMCLAGNQDNVSGWESGCVWLGIRIMCQIGWESG
jgi:hypothetical protein